MGRFAAAVLLAGVAWLPTVSSPPVVHAAVCTGWSSTTTPPPTIRVLRTSGVVQTVDFKTYVKVVMPAEWPPGWPIESMRAGAVAIKQYAWYYTMHYRGLTGTGGCADVYDNSNDQIYAPESQTPAASHIQAVESTWPETLTRSGAFLFTGYRPGTDVACGADADGNRLYQKSARQCALGGKTGEEILHIYYDPVVIWGAPTVPDAPTSVSGIALDTSVFLSWVAPLSDGGSAITRYTVTAAPGGQTCSTTGALSCAVGWLTNGTPYTFTVTATNSVGVGPPSDPSAGVTPGPMAGSTFVPLSPSRILDTRDGTGGLSVLSSHVGQTFQVTGHGGVPANATAVTGNLTVTQQSRNGYLYIGPVAMNNPTSSTLNFPVGDDRANSVTVALGAGGTLSVTYVGSGPGTAQVIFDVTGFFTADTSGATYHPLTPARILDTRTGIGGSWAPLSSHAARTFAVTGNGGVPAGATAVTGNLTVTGQTRNGFFYVGPLATNDPTSSTLNFPVADDRANGVTVALGDGTTAPLGTLSVTYVGSAPGTAQVIFDVTGYFTPDLTGARFVPLTPTRILDTRDGTGLGGVFSSHGARAVIVAGNGGVPSIATAVTGNLTVTGQTSRGFLYAGPDPINDPTSSTFNFPLGDDRASTATVALGAGGLGVTYVAPRSGPTTHVILDVMGYFAPETTG